MAGAGQHIDISNKSHEAPITFRDPLGDFDKADVIAVETWIAEGKAIITIHYAEDEITMAGGIGGNFSIDSDQDPTTGGKDTPGFDCCLIFNISRFAPTANLEFHTGPNQGRTVPITAGAGNGSDLQFNARMVRFTIPMSLLGNVRDFDYALFATGMFSTGDDWDRVPDSGVVRCSTGQVILAPVTGVKAIREQALDAPARAGEQPIVRRITTRMEGDNAIWSIETNADLPVGALDQYNSTHLHLMLDIDRRMDTGISNGEIPFLAFGPDRIAQCSLVPGGSSIRITTGIKENGELETVGGGSGTNDLSCTFDRRTVKITIPLWLIKASSPQMDWMLLVTRLNTPTEIFLNSSISFDTGEIRLPEMMPPHAVVVMDPEEDAIITEGKSNDLSMTKRVPQPNLPNINFTRAQAALTRDFLMLKITYKRPLTLEPRYVTSATVRLPEQPGREMMFSINWDLATGGQVVLWDISANMPDITRHQFLNQCVVNQGSNAFLLIPVSVLGPLPPQSLELVLTTHEIGFLKPPATAKAPGITVKAPPRQNPGTIDRLPDLGSIRLVAN